MPNKNLSFSLIENKTSSDNSVTYESLKEKVDKQSNYLSQNDFDDVNMDDYIASEINYNENYTKKQIDLIADYYEIVKRKKKKAELIEEVVIFEKDLENYDITQRRKTLWFYMEEINNDSFLSKFLILE
jgi:hypothetical protein